MDSNYNTQSDGNILDNVIKFNNYSLNTGLYINGKFTEGVKKQLISVYDPSTEEEICKVSEATEEDVEAAIKSAEEGFKAWSEVSPDEKCKLFMQLASEIENKLEEFSYLESLDNGKPLGDAREDIKEVLRVIRYYGGLVEAVNGKTFSTFDNVTVNTRRVPYGIVGCIVPWNFPLLMASWKIFPALAAGNAVILKPSEETPLTALKLAEVFSKISFPAGVFNLVTGYGNTVGALLSKHKRVNKIAFTGSTGVGRLIMKSAAESNLKNVHLELGGKSPMVVFADADLDNAAEWVINGAFFNSSQNCCCGSRLFIEEKIYDEFVDKLVEKTKEIKVGRFDEEGIFMGPLINKRQFNSVRNYIRIGLEVEKLNCAFGKERTEGERKGYFVQPTIFTHVPEDSKLAREEIFGPVLCIMKPFNDIEEALEKANNTDYGLASGVFTSDMNKAEYFVRNIQAGTVWINYYNITPYNIPFGGMKQSGFGRDNGDEALNEYTTLKAVYNKHNFSKFGKK
jgi:acyl-CoA reductase-like NAD-dependent aldehyde dehydrogenase